jgi:hypothetical protein
MTGQKASFEGSAQEKQLGRHMAEDVIVAAKPQGKFND